MSLTVLNTLVGTLAVSSLISSSVIQGASRIAPCLQDGLNQRNQSCLSPAVQILGALASETTYPTTNATDNTHTMTLLDLEASRINAFQALIKTCMKNGITSSMSFRTSTVLGHGHGHGLGLLPPRAYYHSNKYVEEMMPEKVSDKNNNNSKELYDHNHNIQFESIYTADVEKDLQTNKWTNANASNNMVVMMSAYMAKRMPQNLAQNLFQKEMFLFDVSSSSKDTVIQKDFMISPFG